MLTRLAIATIALAFAASTQAAEISVVGSRIVVKGPFISEDYAKFRQVAETVEGLATVELESNGGSAGAAVLIGEEIRRRKWSTSVLVNKVCASACAFIWLAGTPRQLDRDARVGFHGVYVIEDGKPVVSGPANAVMGSYLTSLGLSTQAIFFVTEAKPEGMNWLTARKAAEIGIKVAVLKKPWERKWAGSDQSADEGGKKGSLLKRLYLRAQQDESAK